jgi:hypothetical protein
MKLINLLVIDTFKTILYLIILEHNNFNIYLEIL